ncbi:hypothetical protein [Lacticaseibacillus absianus]|uniref:hypothetical protein n=1 Tax=Lacticaseibacillus absianus TaxID=2729623 RepID=UPI0015C7E6EE|nr:hypothetical protein [Lacticaseibacillus absianus]
MTDPTELHALIADAADRVVARDFTEGQLRQRVAAWQEQAPDADLASQTTFMLAEVRAFTEAMLVEALTTLKTEADHV